jgi:hypothetical protein
LAGAVESAGLADPNVKVGAALEAAASFSLASSAIPFEPKAIPKGIETLCEVGIGGGFR